MVKTREKAGQKKGISLQQIKGSNLAVVFNQILSNGQISRAEIGRRSHIDPAAVTSLVQELISYNLVMETGTTSLETAGRRPTLLKVNPDGGFCYSIGFQQDGFTLALYDITCQQIWAKKYFDDYQDIANSILAALASVPMSEALERRLCLGISVGFSGLFKVATGEIFSTILPISGRTNLFSRLKEYFGSKPVMIRDGSAYTAYAEQQFGKGKGISDMVSIDIGEGIGSGIIQGGCIISNAQGLGSELGHMTIDINGAKCKCGSRGCLEVICNTVAICRTVNEALEQEGAPSMRSTFRKKGAANLSMIGKALADEDPLIVDALSRHAILLAYAVNNIINLLHPELVVIGGEITTLGPRFLEMIRERLTSMRLSLGDNGYCLEFSNLDQNSALLGGAKYLIDNVLSDSAFYSQLAQEMPAT